MMFLNEKEIKCTNLNIITAGVVVWCASEEVTISNTRMGCEYPSITWHPQNSWCDLRDWLELAYVVYINCRLFYIAALGDSESIGHSTINTTVGFTPVDNSYRFGPSKSHKDKYIPYKTVDVITYPYRKPNASLLRNLLGKLCSFQNDGHSTGRNVWTCGRILHPFGDRYLYKSHRIQPNRHHIGYVLLYGCTQKRRHDYIVSFCS